MPDTHPLTVDNASLPLPHRWARATNYCVRDGKIALAPGADLVSAHAGDGRGVDVGTAYVELAEAVKVFRFSTWNDRFVIPPAAEREILEWCAKYGLLGVLLERLERVVFAPRQDLDDVGVDWIEGGPDEGYERVYGPVAVQVAYERKSGEWLKTHRRGPEGGTGTRGMVIPVEHWPEAEREGLYLSKDWSGAARHVPLNYLLNFLPRLNNRELRPENVPLPSSRQFWLEYAEPLDEFVRAASALRLAIQAGIDFQSGRQPSADACISAVENLLAGVHPQISARSGRLAHTRTANSLLGALVAAAVEDLIAGVLRDCGNCGKWIRSSDNRFRYCSERCRWAAHKRIARKRKKERAEDSQH